MNTSKPLLTVKHLTTSLLIHKNPYPVVNNLSFSLFKGKTLALVGESGSGKSMTALSLMRVLPTPPALPSSGEVIYQNKNLLTIPEKQMQSIRGSHIAMIFQDPLTSLNPVLTIGEQLTDGLERHLSIYGEEAYNKIINVLKDVEIPSPEQRFLEYPYQLSGGMKQRIIIAMALLCDPSILIADEPTTALDVTIQYEILELLKRLQKEKNMALLLITHDMGVVAEMADDVIVMYASHAVEKAPISLLFDSMSHPYTKALFHSRPHLHAIKNTLPVIEGSIPNLHQLPSGCVFHPRCPYVMPACKSGPINNNMLNPLHEVSCKLYDSSSS